jgi:hypothetical protein
MFLTNAVYQSQTTYDYPETGEAITFLKELICKEENNPHDRSRNKHNQIL